LLNKLQIGNICVLFEKLFSIVPKYVQRVLVLDIKEICFLYWRWDCRRCQNQLLDSHQGLRVHGIVQKRQLFDFNFFFLFF